MKNIEIKRVKREMYVDNLNACDLILSNIDTNTETEGGVLSNYEILMLLIIKSRITQLKHEIISYTK